MKNKVLIIFKYPHGHWNIPVIDKFSNFYETEHLYISDYKNKNFTEIVNDINNLIKLKEIEIVVFDVDYFKFINLFFIERINSKTKILITGDDFDLHEMNAITASGCDLVLSGCPLSVLKYQEKGFKAHFLSFEDGNVKKKYSGKKEIDVLFFGYLTPDRKSILEHITTEGISLKNVGHDDFIPGIPTEELIKLISKSKIVINLSKTRTTAVKNYGSENIYRYYYQIKGRVTMAGLNGSACVSEYSPGTELLFTENEMPTFSTKEECAKILKKLLKDDKLLSSITDRFASKVYDTCEDKKNFEPIYKTIQELTHQKVKLIKIPYWYLRIAAKHILLKNIKLTNLLKIIFHFDIIFSIIKHSNFLTKFLIIIESIVNTLWYSFILTFKPKK